MSSKSIFVCTHTYNGCILFVKICKALLKKKVRRINKDSQFGAKRKQKRGFSENWKYFDRPLIPILILFLPPEISRCFASIWVYGRLAIATAFLWSYQCDSITILIRKHHSRRERKQRGDVWKVPCVRGEERGAPIMGHRGENSVAELRESFENKQWGESEGSGNTWGELSTSFRSAYFQHASNRLETAPAKSANPPFSLRYISVFEM